MTTASETIPTLREIEVGLRQRLADLTTLRDAEREKREAAKVKVEQTAIAAANNNSIGEAADDLLIELGLHGRPRDVSQLVTVEVRQTVRPEQVRDIYIGGSQPYGAYMNITESSLFTSFEVNLSVQVPRDHEGCACDIPVPVDTMDAHLGRMPVGVEVVDTTLKWCGYNGYPYTSHADMENRCRNYRTIRAAEQAETHDDPLVQRCIYGHDYTEPHRHIYYRNGDVTYSLSPDYTPVAPSVVAPGWYHTGSQVGQPIPGTPEPETGYNEDDPHRLLACTSAGHPLSEVHLHWQREGNTGLTFTRDLDYVSRDGATQVMGLFTRDGSIVGTNYIVAN